MALLEKGENKAPIPAGGASILHKLDKDIQEAETAMQIHPAKHIDVKDI